MIDLIRNDYDVVKATCTPMHRINPHIYFPVIFEKIFIVNSLCILSKTSQYINIQQIHCPNEEKNKCEQQSSTEMNNEIETMESSNMNNQNSRNSTSNCVNYGPIRYFARKGKAPTLSTGRKSKFEQLDGEEEMKRELRRQKNRQLSQQLKEKREKIVVDLLSSIDQLEQEQCHLFNYIQQLKEHRDDLINAIEDRQQDPLTNLINHNDLTLFFEQYDHHDCDTDLLISTLDY